MAARARLLKELKEASRGADDGISLSADERNIYLWTAVIQARRSRLRPPRRRLTAGAPPRPDAI
jgi:hypothetical protein